MSSVYRESAKRDGDPVQSLRIASTLADRYRTLVSSTYVDNSALELAIGEAQQIYPEIWRHLEEGRAALVAKDRDVRSFDELRGDALRTLGVTAVDIDTTIDPFALLLGRLHFVDVKTATFNVAGYQLAVAACRALMAQMPEVDWSAVARAEDKEIIAFGSLRSAKWISILTWGGMAAGLAVVVIVIHHCATSRPPNDSEVVQSQRLPEGELSDAARLYAATLERIATLKRVYGSTCDRKARDQLAYALRADNREAEASKLELETRCVPERPPCGEIAAVLGRRQAEKFEIEGAEHTCYGAVIAATGSPRTGLVIAVSGTVDRERVVVRGVVDATGEKIIVPFTSSPENAELAGVIDLDGDDVDELVMASDRGFVISKLEGKALRDILGPASACAGTLSIQRDLRTGRGGERRPVLTTPEGGQPKGCPKPGLHYFKLAGDSLVED